MASSGQVLVASSLFTANDADGDSLLYFFYDNSAAATSGHFDVNGAAQAAGTTFAVTQAQLATTTFVAGTTGDDLFVNVWDGVASADPRSSTSTSREDRTDPLGAPPPTVRRALANECRYA
jgi:phage tail sheath gpL-like